jgi:head-tail adaptor
VSVISLCNKSATIQHNIGTADGGGGVPESWATLYADVPCRLVVYSAMEQARMGGLPVVLTGKIYVADTTLAITAGMRAVIGGRAYRIIGKRNPDEMDRYLILDVQEIT